jgi:uracil-DNA glycosylase family 4
VRACAGVVDLASVDRHRVKRSACRLATYRFGSYPPPLVEPPFPSDERSALARLDTEIVTCRACPRLVAWRERVGEEKRAAFRNEEYWARPVPPFGDPTARLVIVGLAPAAHGGNRTGRMFTGDRSGDFLFAALQRAGYANRAESRSRDDGLRLSDAWITVPVRCAPPDNKPTPQERDTCRPFLERELDLLTRAQVFVVLGSFAYQALAGILGARRRPPFAHGVEVALGDGRMIVGSYHVSQQNTFTGRLTPAMLDAIFSRARALCC